MSEKKCIIKIIGSVLSQKDLYGRGSLYGG